MKDRLILPQRLIVIGSAVLIVIGLILRFFRINQNEFILYDEGLYLNYNHFFVKFMLEYFHGTAADYGTAFKLWYKFSLATGKALWFFLIDARAFFGWIEVWFFPRIVSAIAGSLTLGVVYLFASRFYSSTKVGWLTAAFLAILPSHVFYSRLGLQEAISTLFFLSGFYFYVFPRTFGRRTFLSGLLFGLSYFTNYRLIIIPFLVGCSEICLALSEKRRPDFRKYLWNSLTFIFIVFSVGGLDQGQNTVVTFSWMFHQADIAKDNLSWINFLSYPYYFFRLESIFFGIIFFANIFFIWKRDWIKLFPFFLVLLQMGIFSLVEDKAARYICVVLPFAAMSVSLILLKILENWNRFLVAGIIMVLLSGSLLNKSIQLVQGRSNYGDAVTYIREADSEGKLLATQPWILSLYLPAKSKDHVFECPHKFESFVKAYVLKYEYLVLCPQAYISFTEDEKKFSPPLINFLELTKNQVKPIKIFPHLNQTLMDRFVFEHNENLLRSVQFLKKHPEAGQIRIYAMSDIMSEVAKRVHQQKSLDQ